MLPSEEIDMSVDAAMLEATYAQRLLEGTRRLGVTPDIRWLPDETGTPGDEPTSAESPARATWRDGTEPSRSGPTDTVARIELKATLGKDGFFDLNRALAWLRDNAHDVQVEVTIVAAAHEEGFDRVTLRNGVLEPIEEGATNMEIILE